MEINKLLQKLNKKFPDKTVETGILGKKGDPFIWTHLKHFRKLAKFLKEDPDFSLNWAENFSISQKKDTLILSVFLRRFSFDQTQSPMILVLKTSVAVPSPNVEVEVPTLRDLWPSIEVMEEEATELFGVQFIDEEMGSPIDFQPRLLPPQWVGFPLRKNYVFPVEVNGMTHERGVYERPNN